MEPVATGEPVARSGPEGRARRPTRLLAGAFLAMFVLGLVVLSALGRRGVHQMIEDEKSYSNIALELLHQGTYTDSYRAPGYGFFVAGVYGLFGARPFAVFALQVLLLLVQLWITYRIALHVTQRRGPALLAAWLCALWPPFYEAVPQLYSEIFFSVVLGFSFWLLYRALSRPGWRWSAGAGLAFGLAALTKAVLLPFLGIAALLLLGRERSRLHPGRAAAFLLGALCLIAPWTVHNQKTLGAFVPVSTGGGFNFWQGNWPGLYEHPWKWNDFPPPLDSLVAGVGPVEKDRILKQAALEYIREDPLRAAGLCARKFGMLWAGGLGVNPACLENASLPRIGSVGITRRSVAYVPLTILVVIGWVGLGAGARKRAAPIALLLLWWTAIYVAMVAHVRYMLPMAWYQMIFAAVGLTTLAGRLARGRFKADGGEV